MKKMFPLALFVAGLSACNDTASADAATADSLRAATIRDSLASITVPADTARRLPDSVLTISDTVINTTDTSR